MGIYFLNTEPNSILVYEQRIFIRMEGHYHWPLALLPPTPVNMDFLFVWPPLLEDHGILISCFLHQMKASRLLRCKNALEFNFAESAENLLCTQGISYMPHSKVMRTGRCQFSASWKLKDLNWDRTRKLGITRSTSK